MRICSQELADNPEGHIDELRAGLASALEAESIARKPPRQGSAGVSSQRQSEELQCAPGN